MQAGPLFRSSAVALAVLVLGALAGCGKQDDQSPSISVPNPAATDQPSKGTAPAPGVTTGTTAPPVRSPATTGRSPSTASGTTGTIGGTGPSAPGEESTTTTGESTTTTAAP
jgi:hypothetical protein